MAKPNKANREAPNAINTDRVTFPVGTKIKGRVNRDKGAPASNPSTAPAGALSGGQGNLPGQVNNPASGAWANYNAAQNNANAYNIFRAGEANRTPSRIIPARAPVAPHSLPSGGFGLTPWEIFQNWIGSTPSIQPGGAFGQVAGQTQPVQQPVRTFPLLGTYGQLIPTAPPVTPVTAPTGTAPPVRGNPLNYGLNPNPPEFYGTAGMYTYGQFSDPGEAFAELLDRGVPTNIPAYMADRFGMTAALQQPNSGWTLVNGNWTQTSAGTTGGGTSGAGGTSPYAPDPGYTVQPTIGIENFQNTGGENNTDFTQTAYYQWAIANGIPFEQQTRWDERTGRYISVEKYLKNERDRKMKRGHWGGTNNETQNYGGGDYYDYANPYNTDMYSVPAPFTGSWGVVNFNTGGG